MEEVKTDDYREGLSKAIDEDYRYLLDHYTLDDIVNRLRYWLKRIEKVVDDCKLEEKVIINRTALYYFICDYFADIVRLKDFHPVENVNLKKILAYGSYWFLRKHPVNFVVEKVNNKDLYINEKIVIQSIFSSLIEDGKIPESEIDIELLENFIYSLKYRVFTAQTIELFIDGIMRGKQLIPEITEAV